MLTAEELIRRLNLQPHPKEGGWFRETYRAAESLAQSRLPGRYPGERSASTAIYYLLTPTTFSALHRLRTDEVFHFYLGDPVRMLQLAPDGTGRSIVLGIDIIHGHEPQVIVPRDIWQGSMLEPGGRFALLGCTVAPGFDYVDYEHGNRAGLLSKYPDHAELIRRLTID